MIGFRSLNQRLYTAEALRRAIPKYEGKKCFLNHPDNLQGDRKVEDVIGRFRRVRFDQAAGLVADLHYNPKHAFAPTLEYWAANDPDAIGFSHNSIADGDRKDGILVVSEIVVVRSVDLVADPATTRSLTVVPR